MQLSGKLRTIVISETNPVLVDGIIHLFRGSSFFDDFIIESAANPDANFLARIAPDFLIFDPGPVESSPLTVAELYGASASATSLIAYCHEMSPSRAHLLLLNGFRGVIPKTSKVGDFLRAVISVVCGGVFCHEIYRERQTASNQIVPASRGDGTDLSEREAEVLRQVALGNSLKEIAVLLQISTKTVDTYKTRANQKLNLNSRADIVRYAIQSGWMT